MSILSEMNEHKTPANQATTRNFFSNLLKRISPIKIAAPFTAIGKGQKGDFLAPGVKREVFLVLNKSA